MMMNHHPPKRPLRLDVYAWSVDCRPERWVAGTRGMEERVGPFHLPMVDDRRQKMEEGQRTCPCHQHHLPAPRTRLNVFVNGTRICSGNQNCMPIASTNSGGYCNTFLRSNNQLTGWWPTTNDAEEACVGDDNKEKWTEKEDNYLVFGDSSLCYIRNTIFTWSGKLWWGHTPLGRLMPRQCAWPLGWQYHCTKFQRFDVSHTIK